MVNLSSFTEEQIERYSRQIILQEVGSKGQKKLLEGTVVVVGGGGLGCPAIQSLAAAGFGHIKVYDGDKIELSNLPRQILFDTSDVGRFKAEVIKEKVESMNPDVQVEAGNYFVTRENIEDIIKNADYVIEASDNFSTKFLVNDACVHFKVPFTIAGVVKYYGQIFSVNPGKTPCYRCIFGIPLANDPSLTCAGVGVLGTAPSLAGILQANEAIKTVLGLEQNYASKMLLFDLLENSFDFIAVKQNTKCKTCSNPDKPIYLDEDYGRLDSCEA